MKSLEQRVAIVTGAASGIGRATAWELARRGALLVLVDLDEEALQDTVHELEEAHHQALPLVADIADPQTGPLVVERTLREMGALHILVNNAGVMLAGEFVSSDLDDWAWVMDINLWGAVRLTRAALPHMLQQGVGHVATVSSLAGLVGIPGTTAYSASKAALVGFSEALRAEVGDQGVGVSVICPGIVRTNIAWSMRFPGVGDDFRRGIAEKGLAPDKVARTVVRAIRRDIGLSVVSPEAGFLWSLKRFSPALSVHLMRQVLRKAKASLTSADNP